MRAFMDLRNQWVRFRIRDVYLPDPKALLTDLYGSELLNGKVIDMSDSGTEDGVFAVVEVEGIPQRVIVPVQRLLGVL
jgi:hypothetical protein